MLILYPPSSRVCEAPLGAARISGFLGAHGIRTRCLDLSLEGAMHLFYSEVEGKNRRDSLALGHRRANLELLKDRKGYLNFDRYKRAVLELERALALASAHKNAIAALADYTDESLSPLRRNDLIDSAKRWESNVYFPFISDLITREMDASNERLIGLSINYLSQGLCGFAIAGFIKDAFPDAKILLGGGLVTSWVAQGSLSLGDTFEGLVDDILPGRCETGLAVFLKLGIVITPDIPSFDDFLSLPYLTPERIIPYNFSYGCPWKKCTFCPENAENNAYVCIAADRAMQDLAQLAERYQPGLFHFTDNEISPAHLRALTQSPPGVPWYGFARFSGILLDPGFCMRLAAAGCRMLQLGLESGDQDMLEALGKGTNLHDIDRILQNLAEAGILVYLYTLFGTPAEDPDAAKRTRDFVASRAMYVDFMNVAIFNMPVAGPDSKRYDTRQFYAGDLSLYREFAHPKGWNRDAVRRFLSDDFERDPSIRSILLRNPPVFTSNHAPFFRGKG